MRLSVLKTDAMINFNILDVLNGHSKKGINERGEDAVES